MHYNRTVFIFNKLLPSECFLYLSFPERKMLIIFNLFFLSIYYGKFVLGIIV